MVEILCGCNSMPTDNLVYVPLCLLTFHYHIKYLCFKMTLKSIPFIKTNQLESN